MATIILPLIYRIVGYKTSLISISSALGMLSISLVKWVKAYLTGRSHLREHLAVVNQKGKLSGSPMANLMYQVC